MAKNFYYTSPLIDQIRKELKGQLGGNLTDLVEALIDEKIKIGYEDADRKFQVYLKKKKDI